MPAPTVDWKYVFDPLPEVNGSFGSLTASAMFEVNWSDRNAFINSAMGLTSGSSGWPVPQVPWDCPFQPASGLLCNGFRLMPFGVKDTIAPTDNTVEGHFEKAHVLLNFERPRYDFDSPSPQNQIDVTQPILFCEQTIDTTARTIAREGWLLEYIGAPTTVKPTGPAFLIEVQADYVLNFPHVPYIPWNYLEPYFGKTNDRILFGKPAGTICFMGASIKNDIQANGVTRTSCVLKMSYNSTGWNKQLGPDGNLYEVRYKGTGLKPYPPANLAAIWS